jgi:hypothetical protein
MSGEAMRAATRRAVGPAHHVRSPVRSCIHLGSGQLAHSITQPVGWRTRHTTAGTESVTFTAMNFSGLRLAWLRLGDPDSAPVFLSRRRALYSTCALSPVCRQYSATVCPWLWARSTCSAAVNSSCFISLSTSARGNSPQRIKHRSINSRGEQRGLRCAYLLCGHIGCVRWTIPRHSTMGHGLTLT